MTPLLYPSCVYISPLSGGDDGEASKEAFEKEVMILHRVGPHQNIIGLFGVCMQASKSSSPLPSQLKCCCVVVGKYLLVMELASRGNLLEYLHQKRTDKLQPLSVHEVLKFAMQISSGMEHLTRQQVILAQSDNDVSSCSISVFTVIWLLEMS